MTNPHPISHDFPPPPEDADWRQLQRYANIRFNATYLLGLDRGLPLGGESQLTDADAWAMAQEHVDQPVGSRLMTFLGTGIVP